DYGYKPYFNYGDLQFTYPLPDPNTLTNSEKFIIAGGRALQGERLPSWASEVFMLVMAYHSNTGEIPARINVEMIQSLNPDGVEPSADRIEMLKSPITNE